MFLTHALLACVPVVNPPMASPVDDDPPPPPEQLGECCAPAELAEDPPYAEGCSAKCEDGEFSNTPFCALERTFTGPAVLGGACHVAAPQFECETSSCTKFVDQWECVRPYCNNDIVECYWTPAGKANFTYTDCTGHNCWGGAVYTACSSVP
jgi:hypothetical protein